MKIELPGSKPGDYAFVFRIKTKKPESSWNSPGVSCLHVAPRETKKAGVLNR